VKLTEHGRNEVGEVIRIVLGDPAGGSSLDFESEAVHVVGEEGRDQHGELVKEAAKSPDVALAVVRPVVPDLWTHVIGSTNLSPCEASLHQLGATKVTETNVVLASQEDVLGLQVAVEDIAAVHLQQGAADLNAVAPDGVFLDVLVGLEGNEGKKTKK
jgi:hypothetical protein